MRPFTALAAALIAAASLALSAEQGEQKQIYVTVGDNSNAPVKGLTTADFGIREDGTVREVTAAAPASEPAFIVLTIDTSKGDPSRREQLIDRHVTDLRNGPLAFIRQVHEADPKAQIALYDHAGAAQQIKGFTANAGELEREVKRLVFKSDPSVLLESLAEAARELRRRQSPRRIVVAFVFDNSPESSQLPPREVAQDILETYAQVWAITLRDRGNVSPNRDNVINGLTAMTGGVRFTINTASAIEPTFEQLANLIGHQYVVTYLRPQGGKRPEKLEVMVKRDGLRVAAPQWPPK